MSMSRSDEPAAAESGPGWGLKVLMLGGGLLGAMALMAVTSVLPKIGAALAHGPGDGLLIKQLVGIVSLAMVVGAPLSGLLVDRLGLRPVLVASALVYAVAGTAGLYLNGLPLLLASRLFVGVAAAAIQITSITLINTRRNPGDRAKWNGWHVATAMIGTIVVHPLAGFLGEFSWRWPFALYAVGLLVVPIALLDPAIRKAPPADGPQARTDAPRGGPGPLGWFPFHYVLLALFIGGVTYVPMIYVPFLLRQHGLESSTLISLVLTADSAIGAAMALVYGRARRKVSAHGAFAFSFAMTGLGTLVASLSPGVPGVVVGLVIFGFGMGWFISNLMTALAAKVGRAQQGRAAGYVKAAHFLSAPVCVVLMEPLSRAYGPQGVMLTVSATALALLVLMLTRMAQLRRRDHKTARAEGRVTTPAHG